MKRALMIALLASASLLAQDSDDDVPTVVPEPATVGLMAAGIAAFGFAAWRRNRKR